jgi:type IV pilus assembly protein PilC
LVELRRTIGAALVYPTIVMMVAAWLFMYFIAEVAPALVDAYEGLRLPVAAPARSIASLGQRAEPWWALLPLIFPVALAAWWLITRRATLDVSPVTLGLGWTPSARSLLRAGRLAVFCDTLALMVEHNTPLDEAVTLAAEASGDRSLADDARRLTEALRRGLPASQAALALAHFPPLLRWMVLGARDSRLCRALRAAADSYRQQALRQGHWLSVWLPLLLTGVLGGGVTLLYAATVLGPWFAALEQLGQP